MRKTLGIIASVLGVVLRHLEGSAQEQAKWTEDARRGQVEAGQGSIPQESASRILVVSSWEGTR
jgi:hypothetical protein